MRRDVGLRLNDWFCGAGGATQGAHAVPGIVPVLAANHDQLAIDTHSTNFPDVEHFRGDIRDLDVAGHPYAEIFWASPECTNWSQAKGRPVDFDQQPGLFGDPEIAEDVQRSRALMQDVIRYLEGMNLRQQPVLAGVVENVVDIRKWEHWAIWRRRIEMLGYRTRLIALNSMHAQSRWTPRAPQSRDRLYLAYWHESLRRDPDWDRWLRPVAYCPSCDQDVAAVQVWKRPGADMGRYRMQYVYRCPKVACRGRQVEPRFVPAAAAIDWTLPGERIGDRAKPLAAKTIARIEAGIRKYARPISLEAGGNQYDSLDPKHPRYGQEGGYVRAWPADAALTTQSATPTKGVAVPPMLVPAGGTWNDSGQPVHEAMRTRTTRETDAVLVPPLLVPVEGRDGKQAASAEEHLHTQTARNETGLVVAPFVTTHRDFSGAHEHRLRGVDQSLPSLAASGNHHSVVVPPLVVRGESRDSGAKPVVGAMGAITAAGSQFLAVPPMVMRNFTPRPSNGPDGGGYLSQPIDQALGALTTSGHQSVVVPPFIAELRGGYSDARAIDAALATVTASGNHHALVTMQAWAAVYGYDSGALRDHLREPLPTQTTIEGDALLTGHGLPAVEDCLFRMLEPHEIHAGMAFVPDYIVLGNKRQKVRQLGNAVTPPVAEVLVAALVECITGQPIEDVAA